jgi:hypothetical protein
VVLPWPQSGRSNMKKNRRNTYFFEAVAPCIMQRLWSPSTHQMLGGEVLKVKCQIPWQAVFFVLIIPCV